MGFYLNAMHFSITCYSLFKIQEDMCPDNIDSDDHKYDHNININDEVRVNLSISYATRIPLT